MISATISQLKNSLSAYLRKVRKGEAVLILDRDEPVAVMKSLPKNTLPQEQLKGLERAGLLRRSPTHDPLGALGEPLAAKRSVLTALLEERTAAR